MKHIELTNGGTVLVDDAWHSHLSAFRWQRSPQGYAYRAGSRSGERTVTMHRVIAGARKGDTVDHVNRDQLDNRAANLRLVTKSENAINSKPNKANTSGYRNVTFRKDTGKWQAGMSRNGKFVSLGCFSTPKRANAAVQKFIQTGE